MWKRVTFVDWNRVTFAIAAVVDNTFKNTKVSFFAIISKERRKTIIFEHEKVLCLFFGSKFDLLVENALGDHTKYFHHSSYKKYDIFTWVHQATYLRLHTSCSSSGKECKRGLGRAIHRWYMVCFKEKLYYIFSLCFRYEYWLS